MKKSLRFFCHLVTMSLKASLHSKKALLIESLTILANNLIFLSCWWIFFKRFEEVDGWSLTDMTALIAITSGAFGLMQVFFGGIRKIPHLIVSGELDSFMMQPQSILLHIAGSKSFAKGWGHILSAVLLMIYGDFTTPYTLPLIVISMVFGSLVFSSIGIIAYSLPFWFKSGEALSKRYYESFMFLSIYPTHIYTGLIKIILFTILPAGVIGTLPVELLRSFSLEKLFVFIGISIGFTNLSFLLFNLGLKRYESGSQFTLRS